MNFTARNGVGAGEDAAHLHLRFSQSRGHSLIRVLYVAWSGLTIQPDG